MRILGINAFHGDSAACLVEDGRLVAAVEEERFRRIKHWAGFPSEAIHACLDIAGIQSLSSIDHLAVNQDSQANLLRKLGYLALQRPGLSLVLDRLKNRGARRNLEGHISKAFPGVPVAAEIHHIEHHLAHLSSAFYVSPFEEALAVSVDGFGDFASAAWGVGRGTELTVDDRIYFPHSLGIFYQALTQYLGFPNYGDEYKVMGLAPYGQPTFLNEMRRIVRLQDDGLFKLNLAVFRHDKERIDYSWTDGTPEVSDLFAPYLEQLFGPRRRPEGPLDDRHRDIARSVQAMYEEAFFHLLEGLYARYGLKDITLAGGCAMNSVANGKVTRRTPFERVYVQPAAGDAGGAIGAALAVWHRLGGDRRAKMNHAYWGPAFSNRVIELLLADRKKQFDAANCTVAQMVQEETLCAQAARAIASGHVVGWFQGRMEWGARALGNRSILCDPRRGDMKELLNRKIKRRESFRPFAPSILREAVSDWFEVDDNVPFMMKVLPVREEKRGRIPAVTHVDGSGRLQTVSQDANPLYYRLIEYFADLTGVPLVLNTSFNENEPVVCRPEEALDCFLRTEMDVLVMGNWVLTRRPRDVS
jgi:carbamoyltransferase